MADKNNTVKNMTFEQSLQELENIVNSLEKGGQTLDDSINNYSKGMTLKAHCEKKLQEAKLKVEKIVSDAEGNISAQEM